MCHVTLTTLRKCFVPHCSFCEDHLETVLHILSTYKKKFWQGFSRFFTDHVYRDFALMCSNVLFGGFLEERGKKISLLCNKFTDSCGMKVFFNIHSGHFSCALQTSSSSFILGDFNSCTLSEHLPTIRQDIDCSTHLIRPLVIAVSASLRPIKWCVDRCLENLTIM